MALYQCYLWQLDGRVAFCEQIDAASDRPAIEIARRMLAQHPAYATVELWQAMRLVLQEGEPIKGTRARPARYPARGPRIASLRNFPAQRLTLPI